MGIGTSLGAFFDDDHHYNAAQWDPNRYEGDKLMEKSPNGMMVDKQLDTAELDPTTGMGIEVSNKTDNDVDWSHYNQPFGELKDTNPEGAKIATIESAKKLGLSGADITERDVNKATDIAMSSGPNMVVGARAAQGESFWKNLFKATEMKNKGASDKEVLDATGLFKKGNGRMVSEISDEGMKLVDKEWKFGESGKLSDFIEHPELFKAYPEMKDINFKVAEKDEPWIGGYQQTTNTLMVNPSKVPSGDEGLLDVIAHEMQHWVQRKEGFPQGGNPDLALKDAIWKLGSKAQEEKDPAARTEMMKLMSDISKNAKAFSEYMYQRMPGEVEANTTMARRKLSDQQRKEFPIEEFKKFMEGSDNNLSGGKYLPEFNYP